MNTNFKPSSNIFLVTIPRLYLFCGSVVFLCSVFLMLLDLFVAAGKGSCWLCLLLYCITFPCGIHGQVWFLIVSFPDLCHLSYF